jgi:hypothetical protein
MPDAVQHLGNLVGSSGIHRSTPSAPSKLAASMILKRAFTQRTSLADLAGNLNQSMVPDNLEPPDSEILRQACEHETDEICLPSSGAGRYNSSFTLHDCQARAPPRPLAAMIPPGVGMDGSSEDDR